MSKFNREPAPPPSLFFGHEKESKEKDLVKQINDELIEKVIGQQIIYYPVDYDTTDFNLYGEAMVKNFLPPLRIYALVDWEPESESVNNEYLDKVSQITVHFHTRRINEDQELIVRVGDFIYYNEQYYEIYGLEEPRLLFGQAGQKFEISAKCIRTRKNKFKAI